VTAGPEAAGAAAASPARADRRARLAVFWIFALCGVICSLWSTSLPAISARLQVSETRLGVVLLLAAAGAVAVMPLTGRLCDRRGSRAVLRVGAPLSGLSLLGPALAGSFAGLLAAAFVLGAGIGSLDVAMNAHAITVEQRYGRPIMSAFHGFWSVGGVLGSAVIAAGLRFGAADPGLIAGGAVASAALLVLPGPLLLPRREATVAGPAGGTAARLVPEAPAGPRPGVVALLGLVASAGFICEGAAYNWAPLHAIRELHAAPATAALVYTVFATALTIGRLTGDRARRRLGPVRAMAAAGGTAVCGFLLVLLAPSLRAGGLACDFTGWAVAGLGLATVVPAVFSAVGALDGGVGRALSRVAMCGYAGELAGPAVIGPLAGATSLRVAMLVPGALALLVTGLGPLAVSRALRPGWATRAPPARSVAGGRCPGS
jgi:MFS family permease